jgi:hypothetical protein
MFFTNQRQVSSCLDFHHILLGNIEAIFSLTNQHSNMRFLFVGYRLFFVLLNIHMLF